MGWQLYGIENHGQLSLLLAVALLCKAHKRGHSPQAGGADNPGSPAAAAARQWE